MTTTSRAVHDHLDHPVIDADGHVIEFMPAVLPYLREALGAAKFEEYRAGRMPVERSVVGDPSADSRRRTRAPQSAWWGSPAENTRDLATAALPALLYDRLDELGIDFAVLYPTKALGSGRFDDADMRRGVCRGFNDFYAHTYQPFGDRLTVSGIIPMHDPDEAIAELHHCHDIGLKVVAIPEGVWRPIPDPSAGHSVWLAPGQTHWFDNFGLDSEHDYDPVWATFVELGYPLMSHGGLGHIAPNQYISISNYSANHIGSFRDKMYQLCKSLYFAGVTRRFPTLQLGFLECGVGWASTLLADITEHWEKRNLDALRTLDPAAIDYELLERLFAEHGPELAAAADDLDAGLRGLATPGVPPEERDDWRFLQVDSEQELVDLFAPRMFFGCEADDRTVAFAFSPANPKGATMQPIFSSDIAHWDVPDMAGVVAESWELVERGLITAQQYRRFVFGNPVALFGERFFDGTTIQNAVRAEAAAAVRDTSSRSAAPELSGAGSSPAQPTSI
jgi:predicted TIM-barrel fold metal-dependent hydrolase